MMVSVSACGWSCTAVRTATRGRVTRSSAPRSTCSSSTVVGMARACRIVLNESRKRLKHETPSSDSWPPVLHVASGFGSWWAAAGLKWGQSSADLGVRTEPWKEAGVLRHETDLGPAVTEFALLPPSDQ